MSQITSLVDGLKSNLLLKNDAQDTTVYMKAEYLQTKWSKHLDRRNAFAS